MGTRNFHGGAKRNPTRVTRSKKGRLVPKRADSFQKGPTLETAGRLWKETADSGKKRPTLAIPTVCGFPSGTTRPRFSSPFETRRDGWQCGVVWCVKRTRAMQPI